MLAVAGCAKKEITSHDRKQAAYYVSEAEFAATMKDFAQAERLLVQATNAAPDTGVYWISLGSTRMRLGQRSGARDAYKQALSALQDAADKDKTKSGPGLQQIYILLLLGRVDDARALETKLLKQFPNDPDVRAFVDGKRIDQMLADPKFKQFAL